MEQLGPEKTKREKAIEIAPALIADIMEFLEYGAKEEAKLRVILTQIDDALLAGDIDRIGELGQQFEDIKGRITGMGHSLDVESEQVVSDLKSER